MWERSGGKLQSRCAHVPHSHFCWEHEASGGPGWDGGQKWSGGYAGAEDPCWPAGSWGRLSIRITQTNMRDMRKRIKIKVWSNDVILDKKLNS